MLSIQLLLISAFLLCARLPGFIFRLNVSYLLCFTVLHGKVMRKVGVEVVGMGALNLTGFLREQMQQKNTSFGSLYTVRSLKEVMVLSLIM